MHIAHLEDDRRQAEWTKDLLGSAFGDLYYERFSCADEFIRALPNMAKQGLDLVIADVIVRWSPHDLKQDWEPEGGGVRLVEAMRSTPGLEDVPVVFWTVYSEGQITFANLPRRSIVVSKAQPSDHLIRVIRSVLIAIGKTPEMRTSTFRDLSDSVELKPGGCGVSVDLKKAFATLMKKRQRAQQADALDEE